jgi:hypothetical protein
VRLGDLLPVLAQQLVDVLSIEGYSSIARGVPSLPVVRRCCRDERCASFFTSDVTNEEIRDRATRIVPGGDCPGIFCVFAMDDRVCFVELLNRPEVREVLEKHFP